VGRKKQYAPIMVRIDPKTKGVLEEYAIFKTSTVSGVIKSLVATHLVDLLYEINESKPDLNTEPIKAEHIDDDWTPGKDIIDDLAERLISHDFKGAPVEGVKAELRVQIARAMKREDTRAEAEAKADEPTADATADADKA
jgi:hypothetical protein